MVRFKNIEQITNLMSRPDRIRNISIIAHVDHGKSTLTDSLVSRAGLIAANEAGDKTFTDNREDEKERGITIKATALSIPVVFPAPREEFADEEDMYVVNLIDCPGHVDFSGEVTAALRLTDGAVVVVDCIEGVCVQTEVVSRQALEERIKPVLFLNKLDRMFGELNSESEEIYQSLCRTIESVNVLISLFSDSDFKEAADFQADPLVGNVAFGSGLYGWGFTIDAFADMYSRKTGQPKDKWRTRLWGDHFYNSETKKWAKVKGPGFERGFCAFILDPVRKTLQNLQDGDLDTALKKLQKVEVVVDASWEKKIRSLTVKREIIRTFMSKWIPVSEALLQLVVKQIPSPNVSQKYKIPAIYSGPMDDNFALDMQACKTDSAELMAFVAKMVPNEDATRFFGLTRVFSGELVRGEKLRVISADANQSSAVAQRLFIVIGHQVLSVDRIPAGMLVGVSGLEKCLTRSGTLCSHQEAHMFRGMHFSVSSVVRQAVSTVSGKDSKKLVEALRKIEKSDPMVEVFIDDKTGECIIAGVGELHLEICLSDLQKFLDGVELKVSNPIVPFAETISTASDFLCITKSTNKHNHLMATVSKVSDEQIKILEDPFGPLKGDARDKKLWAVNGTNLLMDNSKGVQGLNQIKPSIVKAFEEFSGGVLCEEPVRGMQVDLADFKIHSDNAHRGFNQIAPAAKALFQACQMSGKPRLMEPMYEVSIRVPRDQLSGVYVCLSKRKAILLKTEEIGTNGLFFNIVAHLAVRESFGFTGQLRAETSGQAFPQMSFSHWHLVEGDPLEAGTLANKLIKEVRQRKRLPESLPKLEDFHTKS